MAAEEECFDIFAQLEKGFVHRILDFVACEGRKILSAWAMSNFSATACFTVESSHSSINSPFFSTHVSPATANPVAVVHTKAKTIMAVENEVIR
jgi:hypothetical protein